MKWTPQLVLLFSALAGALTIYAATSNGIPMTPDSAYFYDTAQHVLKGEGFSAKVRNPDGEPYTYSPPLYPAMIAAADYLGFNGMAAVRGIAILFAFINIGTVVALLYFLTSSWPASLLGGFIILSLPSFLSCHLFGLSEPLLFCFMLWSFYWLARYLAAPQRSSTFLVLSALFAAFAAFALGARFLGGVVVIVASIALLIWKEGAIKGRLRANTLFLPIALSLGLAWGIRNQLIGSTATGRKLDVALPTATHIQSVISTLLSNVGLDTIEKGFLASLIAFAILAAIGFWLYQCRDQVNLAGERPVSRARTFLLRLLLLFSAAYLVLVHLAITLVNHATQFSIRIGAPAVIAFTIVLIAFTFNGLRRLDQKLWQKGFIIAMSLLVVVGNSATSWRWFSSARAHERGLMVSALKKPQFLSFIDQVPLDRPVYSNAYDAIFLNSQRYVYPLPAIYKLRFTKQLNPHYSNELEKLRSKIQDENAIVIVVDEFRWRNYMISERGLMEMLPVRLSQKSNGFRAYEWRSQSL